MKFWIDAQLPPALAIHLAKTFAVDAQSLREIGLRDAADWNIYEMAKAANSVIVSKDSDFVDLISRFGSPPKLIWVTCGNVSNEKLRQVFDESRFRTALALLNEGQSIVEIG
jgi:predicted nuclease of predicted toxin-antitoxin system